MQLSDFDFELPADLIAQYPLPQRSASRLLVLNRGSGKIEHKKFTDLLDYLTPNDLLVFNNTRVIPARLYGKKVSGGKVEILVERILSQQQILAHVKNSKSLKVGDYILLEKNYRLEIIEKNNGILTLKFIAEKNILTILDEIGHIPLPPYINRADEIADKNRYQTIFAEKDGAVAAPTASLHFDENLLKKIAKNNIKTAFVTLHVGAGTFQPVKTENLAEHKMHSEYLEVSDITCELIRKTKQQGGRIIAVGTTVIRALETAAKTGEIKPFQGDTDIFIYGNFKFKIVDVLITNFHLPKSTLLMLVVAFAGYENVMNAYHQAINEKYRFFSYGDAMLIHQ